MAKPKYREGTTGIVWADSRPRGGTIEMVHSRSISRETHFEALLLHLVVVFAYAWLFECEKTH